MYSVGTRFAWQRRARPPYAKNISYARIYGNVIPFVGILSYLLRTPIRGFIEFWTTAGKGLSGWGDATIHLPSRK